MDKDYLGDSVYIEKDNMSGGIVLTTDNGMGPDAIIYMEPDIIREFEAYIKRHRI